VRRKFLRSKRDFFVSMGTRTDEPRFALVDDPLSEKGSTNLPHSVADRHCQRMPSKTARAGPAQRWNIDTMPASIVIAEMVH